MYYSRIYFKATLIPRINFLFGSRNAFFFFIDIRTKTKAVPALCRISDIRKIMSKGEEEIKRKIQHRSNIHIVTRMLGSLLHSAVNDPTNNYCFLLNSAASH